MKRSPRRRARSASSWDRRTLIDCGSSGAAVTSVSTSIAGSAGRGTEGVNGALLRLAYLYIYVLLVSELDVCWKGQQEESVYVYLSAGAAAPS